MACAIHIGAEGREFHLVEIRGNMAQELCDCAPWVRVIDDANALGTITKATCQGHHAALDI